MLRFKPFKDLESALKNYHSAYGLRSEIKIVCHNNIRKDEGTLIDAAILCKVLTTFYEFFDQLKKQYNIEHVGHTFWFDTTWQMKYKSSTYCFVIHSQNKLGEPHRWSSYEDKICTKSDMWEYADTIRMSIEVLLSELKRYAPEERFESIKEHIQRICDSD